mmetsp:Transcript_36198/g.42309  ORF Transcript_36198/g.42309 Transcript_36198/m.42309 type:complete len:247 (-) Transcript_36198:256-996(-)
MRRVQGFAKPVAKHVLVTLWSCDGLSLWQQTRCAGLHSTCLALLQECSTKTMPPATPAPPNTNTPREDMKEDIEASPLKAPTVEPKEDTNTSSPLTLKQKLALYGSGGLLLYIIIHDIFLFFIFTGMYVMGLDLVGVATSYGFNVIHAHDDSPSEGTATTAEGTNAEGKKPSFFATLLTALVLTKLFAPIQLPLTLLLAPRFVPLLEPFANRVIPKIKRAVSRFVPFRRQSSKTSTIDATVSAPPI